MDQMGARREVMHTGVPEYDWGHLNLNQLHAQLTEEVMAGSVLHGSRQPDLTLLKPFYSEDAVEYKSPVTAVFATDQPLLAIARAAAGDRLKAWTRQFVFVVDELKTPLPKKGWVYVCRKSDFVHDVQDSAEYLSSRPVTPVKRVAINARTMDGIWRSVNDLTKVDHLKIRESDGLAALLTLRGMLQLMGNLGYSSGHEQFESLTRAHRVTMQIEHVLRKIDGFGKLRGLKKEVWEIFDRVTYGVHETNFSGAVEMVHAIDMSLRGSA